LWLDCTAAHGLTLVAVPHPAGNAVRHGVQRNSNTHYCCRDRRCCSCSLTAGRSRATRRCFVRRCTATWSPPRTAATTAGSTTTARKRSFASEEPSLWSQMFATARTASTADTTASPVAFHQLLLLTALHSFLSSSTVMSLISTACLKRQKLMLTQQGAASAASSTLLELTAVSLTGRHPLLCREDFEKDKVADQWREHPSEAMRNPSEKEWYTTAYFAGQVCK